MGTTTSSIRDNFALSQQTTITTTTTTKSSKSYGVESVPLTVRPMKVLVLGGPRVGKTGIVRRWLHNAYDGNPASYIPTTKVDLSNKMIQIGDRVVQLEVWDTPSHPDIRDVMLDQYFRDADIVVLVGDVAKPASFRDLQANIVPQLAKYCSRHYQGVTPVTMFLANKNDLQYDAPVDGDPVGAVNVSAEVCQVMGDGCGAMISALVSAKLAWGVEEALERAVAAALPLSPRVWQPLTAETLQREAEEAQREKEEREAAEARAEKEAAEEEKEQRRLEVEMLRAEGFAVSDDDEDEDVVVGGAMQVVVDGAESDRDHTGERVPLTPMVVGPYDRSEQDSATDSGTGAGLLIPAVGGSDQLNARPQSHAAYGSAAAFTPRHEPTQDDDDEFDEEEPGEEEEENMTVGGGRPSTAPMKRDSPTRSPRKPVEPVEAAAAVAEAGDDEFDDEESPVKSSAAEEQSNAAENEFDGEEQEEVSEPAEPAPAADDDDEFDEESAPEEAAAPAQQEAEAEVEEAIQDVIEEAGKADTEEITHAEVVADEELDVKADVEEAADADAGPQTEAPAETEVPAEVKVGAEAVADPAVLPRETSEADAEQPEPVSAATPEAESVDVPVPDNTVDVASDDEFD